MISQLLVSMLRPRLGIFVPLIQGKTAVNQDPGGSLTLLHLICPRPLPPPARPDNSIRVSVCQNSKNRIFFICLHCHLNNSFLLNQQIINIFPQLWLVCRDPVQLNLLYEQAKEAILDGTHPVPLETAIQFGALQVQIQFGDHKEDKHKPGMLAE